jgi:protein-S-isoprenylcysteine O-methyltransferase Ste14
MRLITSLMTSLILRNLLFTILQPGIVVGVLPYLLLKGIWEEIVVPYWRAYHFIGAVAFGIGLAIMFACIAQFAVQGNGTLSPADPTKRLVVRGLYRFSRNPMYVGVVMSLVGESIFTKNIALCIYTAVVAIGFHLFVTRREEPRLRRDFGEEYIAYCNQARRWF